MKKYLISVNGNEYEVEVEELSNGQREEKTIATPVVESKPQSKPQVAKKEEKKVVNVPAGAETVEAPMPGTILRINVNVGDEVKAGQELLILEAMKMENEILAPRDGKVAAVHVSKGASVNTGDKLVSIE